MTERTVAALTLGCKVNMYDTEAILELFEEKGYKTVDFNEAADVYIINTCTVTNLGDRKSRQMIRRARKKNPRSLVVATGCYAQVSPEEVAAIEGINLITGVKDRGKIVELVESCLQESPSIYVDDVMSEREFEGLQVKNMHGRTRAFLKIQEGCDRFCAYCVIPYARGPVRSREPEAVIEEVIRLSEKGFKEIVLAGIHVASYGKDLGNIDLIGLIERVHEVDGIERIRLSSIDPTVATEEFVTRLSKLSKICEHFHLSLQSGCDKTLKKMNRRYTGEDYEAAADRLRRSFNNAALTTDIIVGFPGETAEDFDESYEFVKRIGFSRLHVFPYSPKKGTPAAEFPGQIPAELKEERAKKMSALGDEMSREFLKQNLGKKMDVLFERKEKENIYEGHTRNYINIKLRSDEEITNRIISVVLDENIIYND